jgi:DNA-binding CsgD family transcriptional regulator
LPAKEEEIDLVSTRADSEVAALLGRDEELAQLYDLIDGIGRGGGALVVRGEAGIGKSALLEAAAVRARERDVTVVSATGKPSEARFSFAGLHQLLLPFLEGRDRLPEPQRRALDTAIGLAVGDAPDPFLVGLATLGLLTETEAKRPLLFLVEDAQWLDGPSSEVLVFVARRLELEPVIVLCAVREGIASLVGESGLAELHLDGLDEASSRALLELTAPNLPSDLEARILDEAAGNPLALIELPVAAASLDGAASPDALPLPTRLEQAFAARLSGLDSDTRRLLLLAALEDGELPELDRDPAAWAPAVAAVLGTVDHGTFRFRHPLIRSAVVQAATPQERRQAHAAHARAFQNDPDRAVWHRAALAVAGPDEEVAKDLEAAAERARLRGGRDVALAALERAAELSVDRGLRALRLFRAGELAYELGRSTDSARLLRAAQQLGLPPQERALASFHVEVLEPTWSGAATVRSFAGIAQELAEAGHDDQALQTLSAIALRAHWENLDQETRRDVAQIAEQLAGAPDEPARLATLALFDPVGQGAEILRRVMHMAPLDVADPEGQFNVGQAASAVWADNLALPFLRAASAGYRADGRLGQLAQTLVFEAWAELRQGAARVAITAAAEAVQLAEETRRVAVVAGQLAEAIAAVEMGTDEPAEQLIGAAEATLLPLGANPLLSLVALARGRQALAHERFAEAYTQLLRIFDPNDAAYQQFVGGWVLADLADAALQGDGDRAVVDGLLREWEAIATATGAPHLDVQLRYANAILADEGNAEPLYESALSAGADGWPFYAARAQLAYGGWLRRQHRMTDSRAPLREAAQSFEALGLLRYADRSRRELRASGEAPRRRAPEAWVQLTPQELQIAQLAAEGLSNREIGERLYLSHRTVGSHLYRLFPKLGVTSRTQLRGALGPASPD